MPSSARYDGRPLVEEVWTREQAFAGPFEQLGPDLSMVLADGGTISILPSETIVAPPPAAARPPPLGGHLHWPRARASAPAPRSRNCRSSTSRRCCCTRSACRPLKTWPAACPSRSSSRASSSGAPRDASPAGPPAKLVASPAAGVELGARGAGGADGAPARAGVRRVSARRSATDAEDRRLQNGVRIHYQQIGEGPDLVMVHGLTGNLAVWHLQIVPELSEHFRVLTYDLRGHGHSDTPPTGLHARRDGRRPAGAARRARDRASADRRPQLRRRHRALPRARAPRARARGDRDRGGAAGARGEPAPGRTGSAGPIGRARSRKPGTRCRPRSARTCAT